MKEQISGCLQSKGIVPTMNQSDRALLRFEYHARNQFSFLLELGFSEVESSPTLVRFQSNGILVSVYHGRRSYEISVDVEAFDTNYSLGEILDEADSSAFENFYYPAMLTEEGVVAGLEQVSQLFRRYGGEALNGCRDYYLLLDKRRKQRSKDYSMDVLARQLRPKANDAFREKDYATAVELFSQIQPRLSPVELKKLSVARERSGK